MGARAKITDNQLVSEWLIQNRWLNSLNTDTKQHLPGFIDDAVWAAIAIVAGVNNGKVNISPKLVKKALMLKTISTEAVKLVEYGYDMSERQARRLAQTARFALNGIRHRIQEYENSIPEDIKLNWKQEKKFVQDYYDGKISNLYVDPIPPIPEQILSLYQNKEYSQYVKSLVEWNNNGRRII